MSPFEDHNCDGQREHMSLFLWIGKLSPCDVEQDLDARLPAEDAVLVCRAASQPPRRFVYGSFFFLFVVQV